MYRFPSLAECRRLFAEDFGQSLDHLWGGTGEDWETDDPPAAEGARRGRPRLENRVTAAQTKWPSGAYPHSPARPAAILYNPIRAETDLGRGGGLQVNPAAVLRIDKERGYRQYPRRLCVKKFDTAGS